MLLKFYLQAYIPWDFQKAKGLFNPPNPINSYTILRYWGFGIKEDWIIWSNQGNIMCIKDFQGVALIDKHEQLDD